MRKSTSFAVLLLAVGTGLALSLKPWQVYNAQRKKSEEAERRADAAQAERVELSRQKALLDSPSGKERIARERGYVKPGETPLPKP